jgi:prepilin peptidase CpaA
MLSATLGAHLIPISIVAVVALIAAVVDVRSFKVHNRLTIPLAISGLLFHTVQSGGAGFAFSFIGLLVGFASLIVFYAMGGLGAGDVKLMAGIGAWLGVWLTMDVVLIAGVAAGGYSLVVILCAGGLKNVMTNFSILVFRVRSMAVHFGAVERVEKVVTDVQNRHRRLVPFAAMILMGIVAVILGADSILHP